MHAAHVVDDSSCSSLSNGLHVKSLLACRDRDQEASFCNAYKSASWSSAFDKKYFGLRKFLNKISPCHCMPPHVVHATAYSACYNTFHVRSLITFGQLLLRLHRPQIELCMGSRKEMLMGYAGSREGIFYRPTVPRKCATGFCSLPNSTKERRNGFRTCTQLVYF